MSTGPSKSSRPGRPPRGVTRSPGQQSQAKCSDEPTSSGEPKRSRLVSIQQSAQASKLYDCIKNLLLDHAGQMPGIPAAPFVSSPPRSPFVPSTPKPPAFRGTVDTGLAASRSTRLPLRKMGDALPKVGKRCHLADRCRKGQSLLPRCPLPDKERLGRRRRVRSLVWPGGRVRRRVLPVRCRRPFPHRVRLLRPRCRVRRLRSRGLHGPAGSACQDGAGYGISCFRSGPLVV